MRIKDAIKIINKRDRALKPKKKGQVIRGVFSIELLTELKAKAKTESNTVAMRKAIYFYLYGKNCSK